ncbi:hypothetical protein JL721_1556 [Aureococcus anophagefferens]|nr:hypothetical protein JL721_1556 [Aureococcus anophagefferens]
MSTWADAEDEAAQPAPVPEMGALGLGDAPGSPGPEKPKIALTSAKAEEPVVEAACDASWSAADVVKALCDALVATGKLRATPAFIRTDREAKLVKIFEKAKLDGAKLASFGNARELEIVIRNATQGEGWVDDVQKAMKTFLPADVQRAKVANAESEEAKKGDAVPELLDLVVAVARGRVRVSSRRVRVSSRPARRLLAHGRAARGPPAASRSADDFHAAREMIPASTPDVTAAPMKTPTVTAVPYVLSRWFSDAPGSFMAVDVSPASFFVASRTLSTILSALCSSGLFVEDRRRVAMLLRLERIEGARARFGAAARGREDGAGEGARARSGAAMRGREDGAGADCRRLFP